MFTPFAFIIDPSFYNPISPFIPSESSLFLGGPFYSYKSPPAVRIVKIQPNGLIDSTFVTSGSSGTIATSGLSGNVLRASTQLDGKIILTYSGITYTGISSTRVVRINQNGSLDSTFNVGNGFLNSDAYGVKCQSDGKTIFGGLFTQYSGSSVNRITRVNSSGSRDTTFNVGTGPNSAVYDVDVQSDGKVIAAGSFTTYSGSSNNYIVRINTDGTKDTTFNLGTGFNSTVYEVRVAGDGKIVVAGTFTTYSGSAANYIIRLNSDGTRDTTFNLGTGFNSVIYRLSVQSDYKILAMGGFSSYSGSSNNYIVRINASGSKDTTFNVGTGFNAIRNSYDMGGIQQISDGTIYVNGAFATYSGSTVNGVMRLNDNGTINTTFNTSGSAIGYSTPDTNTNFGSFLVTSGSSVITVGNFTSYRSTPLDNIIFLTPSGSKSPRFNTGRGFNSQPRFSLDNQDGNILISGFFTTYSGSAANYLIKLNSSGSRDTTFNPGNTFTSNGIVYSGYLVGNSQYLLAGDFSTYSGSTVNRIARINSDGTINSTFNAGAGANGGIYKISRQSDEKIIAVGLFTTYSGSSNNYIVRINTDGTKDATFNLGTGFNGLPYDSQIQSDQKVIVAGGFTTYSGSANNNRIIRLNTNGTRDTTFNTGTGFNNNVFGFFLQSNEKIIAVGSFTTYSGSSNNSIVRINTDGTKDTTFNVGTGISPTDYISSFVSNNFGSFDNSGSFYLGGGIFFSYSGSTVGKVVKITPSGSLDLSFQTSGSEFNGFDSAVTTILSYNV
jgi:uncharacterized delta-60 repeat protein